MMQPDQEARLTGGGDCFDHYHSSDRQVNHDTLDALIALEDYKSIVHADSTYTVRPGLDYLLADAAAGHIDVILPDPSLGLSLTVVKIGAAHSVIMTSPSGTINGAASYTLSTSYSVAKFKALGGNYYAVVK